MIQYLKKLIDERNALTQLQQSTTDKAVTEDRELTDDERTRIASWQSRCGELDSQITDHKAQVESQRSWAALQDQLRGMDDVEPVRNTSRVPQQRQSSPDASREWGETFIESEQFRAYDGRGTSGRVEVGGLFEQRAPIDTSWMDVPPFRFTPVPYRTTTPLLDVLGRQRVTTGAIEWYTFGTAYPMAEVVAEGALKPEADIVPTQHTASLKTYAHWKAITRQALEDIPRIQSIVETQLRGGLFNKLEADVAALLAADTDIPDIGADDLLTGIRIAIGNVQDAGYASPNAVILNPADFAALDVAIMGATVAGPVRQGTVWGVRAIAASAVPAGTAYVGDMSAGLTLFDRGTTAVMLTDSHADFFVRNLLVILAETRALPAITEPLAIERVTVAGAGGGALEASATGSGKTANVTATGR